MILLHQSTVTTKKGGGVKAYDTLTCSSLENPSLPESLKGNRLKRYLYKNYFPQMMIILQA